MLVKNSEAQSCCNCSRHIDLAAENIECTNEDGIPVDKIEFESGKFENGFSGWLLLLSQLLFKSERWW